MSTPFDERWLKTGACVPVDIETVAALVAEIHRLIGVVGGMALARPEQEPVAWLTRYISGELDFDEPNNASSVGWSAAFPVYEVVTHSIKAQS